MEKKIDITKLLIGFSIVLIIVIISCGLVWITEYTNIAASMIIKCLTTIIWVEALLILFTFLYWYIFRDDVFRGSDSYC